MQTFNELQKKHKPKNDQNDDNNNNGNSNQNSGTNREGVSFAQNNRNDKNKNNNGDSAECTNILVTDAGAIVMTQTALHLEATEMTMTTTIKAQQTSM